jgi:hypothetical protein
MNALDREKARTIVLSNIIGLVSKQTSDEHKDDLLEMTLDALEACVVPVEGVVLTPDEASACAWALDHLVAKHAYDGLRSRDGSRVDLRALAERLEQAS